MWGSPASASRFCRRSWRTGNIAPVPAALLPCRGGRQGGTRRSSMRERLWIAVLCALTAGALALAGFGTGRAASSPPPRADRSPNAVAVDVELVLAVDVSYSMDPEEQALQREGYITGLTSREFLQALRQGANGKVALTYFEWAGPFDQKIIMPWRLIDGPE